MEADEFKAKLASRGWSQRRFAELTGTPRRTVENWAVGTNRIPSIVDRYFEALDEIDNLSAEIERLRRRIGSLGGKV